MFSKPVRVSTRLDSWKITASGSMTAVVIAKSAVPHGLYGSLTAYASGGATRGSNRFTMEYCTAA